MGYVMFRIKDKMRLIAKLRGVRNDLIGYNNGNDTFWEVDSKTPIYVDNFDNVWSKAEIPKDCGSCYIKITEDNEIECEFNEDESIEVENGGGAAVWIISN